MKQRIITPLLFAIIFLAACKKDVLAPDGATSIQTSPGALIQSSSATQTGGAVTGLIKGFVRVQLAKDTINTDDVVIGFDAAASPLFVFNEDARTFPGFGQVSLSSLTSDNVPCAINVMPFPVKGYKVPLVVHAKIDGTYKLNITQIDSIPKIFDLWLMDSYKKDSLDYRGNKTYLFDLANADTNSFGSHRFSLVIRQNKAFAVHLLNFGVSKSSASAQINWTTENEENYTTFIVQRSTDNGQNFKTLTTVISSASGSYAFADKAPVTGSNQYRVVIKDLNGTLSYSNILSLNY